MAGTYQYRQGAWIGPHKATDELTPLPNRHRHRGKRSRTIGPHMRPGNLFIEQPMTSPLLEKDKKFQKSNTKMPHAHIIHKPMRRTKKGSKLAQDANTIRSRSNISTNNTTPMNLHPRPIQEGRGKEARSTLTQMSVLRVFFLPP